MFSAIQVDYFGIAATVHVLLTGQYMSVVKDPQDNYYRLQKPLRRYIYIVYRLACNPKSAHVGFESTGSLQISSSLSLE